MAQKKNEEKAPEAEPKEQIKTSDASLAANVRKIAEPGFIVIAVREDAQTASLPNGKVIEFKNGRARVTREDLVYFQDERRFRIKTVTPEDLKTLGDLE